MKDRTTAERLAEIVKERDALRFEVFDLRVERDELLDDLYDLISEVFLKCEHCRKLNTIPFEPLSKPESPAANIAAPDLDPTSGE